MVGLLDKGGAKPRCLREAALSLRGRPRHISGGSGNVQLAQARRGPPQRAGRRACSRAGRLGSDTAKPSQERAAQQYRVTLTQLLRVAQKSKVFPTLQPTEALCPPCLGAMRSSSFRMRKRFRGAGGSGGRGGSVGVRSLFGSMLGLLEKRGCETAPPP